uniref:Uncharacterized protein n=1 Tax=Solanum lycopersicum TaxID=4081 RepID=A0A3Q7IUD5_SOLLC
MTILAIKDDHTTSKMQGLPMEDVPHEIYSAPLIVSS